jgi:hypothetical protein
MCLLTLTIRWMESISQGVTDRDLIDGGLWKERRRGEFKMKKRKW